MIEIRSEEDLYKLKPNRWTPLDEEIFRTFGFTLADADMVCLEMAKAAVQNGFIVVRMPSFSFSKQVIYLQVYERCPCRIYDKGTYDAFTFQISWMEIGSLSTKETTIDKIVKLISVRLAGHVLEDEEKANKENYDERN